MNKDSVCAFPCYSHMSSERLERSKPNIYPSEDEVLKMSSVSTDEVVSLIFAPDPVTGIPRSDLGVIMSKDSAPEVAQYIRDNLLRGVSSPSGADDPDFVLDSMRSRGESLDSYSERLRELCK